MNLNRIMKFILNTIHFKDGIKITWRVLVASPHVPPGIGIWCWCVWPDVPGAATRHQPHHGNVAADTNIKFLHSIISVPSYFLKLEITAIHSGHFTRVVSVLLRVLLWPSLVSSRDNCHMHFWHIQHFNRSDNIYLLKVIWYVYIQMH